MAEKMSKDAPVDGSEEITSILDLLLGSKIPNVSKQLPKAEYRVDRLSELAGKPVVFQLQALPYGRVHELQKFTEDSEIHILLAGCVSPDLKLEQLKQKFGGETPAETVKAMLLPGEIADLSAAVERLSGYRRMTITEVKNA